MSAHLVIAAFWTDADAKATVDAVFHGIDGLGIPGTGGISALAEGDVDRALRATLRTIEGLEDAANA